MREYDHLVDYAIILAVMILGTISFMNSLRNDTIYFIFIITGFIFYSIFIITTNYISRKKTKDYILKTAGILFMSTISMIIAYFSQRGLYYEMIYIMLAISFFCLGIVVKNLIFSWRVRIETN